MRMPDQASPNATIHRFLIAAVFAAITPVGLTAQADSHTLAAVSVSPGGLEGDSKTAPRCPTFSWGLLLADEVEFAVYDVTAVGELDPSAHRLHELLPGSVTSWTPPAESCFEPGETYAWSVRGLIAGEAAGGWSEARTFKVAAAPTDEDIREALETLAHARASKAPSPSRLPWESSPKTLGSSPNSDQLAVRATGGATSLTPPVLKEFSVESAQTDTTAIYAKNVDGQAGYFDGDVAISGGLSISKTFGQFDIGAVVEATAQGGFNPWAVRGESDYGGEGFLGIRETGVFGKATTASGVGVLGQNLAGGPAVKGIAANGGNAGEFEGPVEIAGYLDVTQPSSATQAIRASGEHGGVGRLGVGSIGVYAKSNISPGNTDVAPIVGVNDLGGPAGLFRGNLLLNGELDCSIGTPCVGASELAPGAILAQHLENLHASIYKEQVTSSSMGSNTYAEVFCRDDNDIPLQGYCTDLGETRDYPLKSFEPIDWGKPGSEAGWRCRVRNNAGTTSSRITAGIVCLEVP